MWKLNNWLNTAAMTTVVMASALPARADQPSPDGSLVPQFADPMVAPARPTQSTEQSSQPLQAEVQSSTEYRQPLQAEASSSVPYQQQAPLRLQAQRYGQQIQATPQAPWVNQQQPQHGQMIMGIIGFHVSDFGVVQSIYPGSDVLRYGIHPGDRVVGYNGHQFISVQNIVDEAVGVPGSIFPITFLHDGQVATLPIKRVDAREFRHFANWGYNHIDQAMKMDRSW